MACKVLHGMNCICICNAFLTQFFIFCTDDDEHEWIVRTCRKGWDEIVGYQQNPADKFIKPLSDNDIAQTDNAVTTATTATAPPATVSAAT